MTHHDRKKLEKSAKHFFLYTGRIIAQTVSNFWETGKTQQIITMAVLAVLAIVIGLYSGKVEWNWGAINKDAIITVFGWMFLLVLVVNFIRTPFNLTANTRKRLKKKSVKSAG